MLSYCCDIFVSVFFLPFFLIYSFRYVGCWIIDFDQETKMHTVSFLTDYSVTL